MKHPFSIIAHFTLCVSLFTTSLIAQQVPAPTIAPEEKKEKQPDFLYAKKYDAKVKAIQIAMGTGGIGTKRHPKQKQILETIPDLTIIIKEKNVIWKVEKEEYKLTDDQLKKKLKAVSGALAEDIKVIIKSSPQNLFNTVVKVLDIVQKAGYGNITFAVDKEGQEKVEELAGKPVGQKNRFTVGGFVKNPNVFKYRVGIRLYDAYCEAGQASEFGDVKRVKLIRNGKSFIYDLSKDAHKQLKIYPGDMIEVMQKRWQSN